MHLVDRLARDGYVRRETGSQDTRVSYAVLREAGLEKRRAAKSTHLNGVRKHFLSNFSNSIQEGKVLPSMLLRKLTSYSHKNRLY